MSCSKILILTDGVTNKLPYDVWPPLSPSLIGLEQGELLDELCFLIGCKV